MEQPISEEAREKKLHPAPQKINATAFRGKRKVSRMEGHIDERVRQTQTDEPEVGDQQQRPSGIMVSVHAISH
jgi:hypothetical protein